MMGGLQCRSSPHVTGANHLWYLTSDAPDWLPSRLFSFLQSSLRTQDLPMVETAGWSEKWGSCRRTLAKVAWREAPLKGVTPYSIS